MTAAEVAALALPCAWDEPLVGWDGWNEWQGCPPPPATEHTRILYGPHLEMDELALGRWLELAGGEEALIAACGPEDIVWLPLLRSTTDIPAWSWEDDRCADWEKHAEIIRELAPRVKGILLGNMGPEFVGHVGGGKRFRCMDAVLLAAQMAKIVLDAGGTPFFGTGDWTLLMDCYTGGSLRDFMGSIGAVQICFCGYALHPDAYYNRNDRHYKGQAQYQVQCEGTAPGPLFCEYLRSVPIWTDLNWMDGYEAGNDKLLAGMGFDRGCL